jgi:TonB family protein
VAVVVTRPGVRHIAAVVVTLASGLLAAQAPAARGAQGDVVRITQVTRFDGTQQIWEISRARLQALPPWNSQSTTIPLALTTAVDIAEKWAARQNPDAKRWHVVSATLMPLVSPIGGTTPGVTFSSWYYRVQLAPDTNTTDVLMPGPAGDARRSTVVVLMDGSVVEPRSASAPPAATQVAPPGRAAPRLVPGTTDVYLAWPGTGVQPPQPLDRPLPVYTAEAKRRVIQGLVFLQCVVDTDGRCQDIVVTRSLDAVYGLDEQAIKTARQWRFAPGTLDGKPVKVRVDMEFSFNLR